MNFNMLCTLAAGIPAAVIVSGAAKEPPAHLYIGSQRQSPKGGVSVQSLTLLPIAGAPVADA